MKLKTQCSNLGLIAPGKGHWQRLCFCVLHLSKQR